MTPRTVESLAARYGAAYKWYATVAVMLGCVATVLSSTMVNVAMPDIMGEFGMGQDQVQWLSTAFLAAMTASMLLTGWALAAYGPLPPYLAALAAFVAGSLLGGSSGGEETLILSRVIQGAAAGLIQPVAMVVILTVFDPSRRGTAMGIYTLGIVVAPALGPTVGGMLIDNYSWRYIFFLGVPLCLLGAVLALPFLPRQDRRETGPFDLPGFLLLCLAVGALLAGLSNGQRQGWDSGFVRLALGASACAWAGFLARERACRAPLLALGVYANPRFLAAAVVSFILGMGLFGSTYLIPLFVQTVQGYTPTEAGLMLMPAGLAIGLVSPVSGRLADRVPPYLLIIAGLALFAWSGLLMTEAGTSTDFWTFTFWVLLGRLGLGCITPALNSGAVRVLDPGQMGQGAGNINFMRQLGGAVGVSLLSVYLERQTTLYCQAFNNLQTGGHAAADALDVVSLLLSRAGVYDDVSQALRPEAVYHFLSEMVAAQGRMLGFRESFLLTAAVFAVAIVPAWFMRRGGRTKGAAR
ncbi:DHA2 family efflux MFS transporter permease subunit [Solidesulfovibrio sp.]|uniref:DHA2 family efflux MFS transporter permease subunit n=1 Tax=Solidesulfovibrio sp. TaxID=2910990 RepID=UPI0026370042|nr:DHA2 family efflux MFS transporter permease subunit [Solidesulfovibrio sp.]